MIWLLLFSLMLFKLIFEQIETISIWLRILLIWKVFMRLSIARLAGTMLNKSEFFLHLFTFKNNLKKFR